MQLESRSQNGRVQSAVGPIFGGEVLLVNATDGFICTSRQKWEDWNGLVARKGFLLLHHRPLYLCHQAPAFFGRVHFAFGGQQEREPWYEVVRSDPCSVHHLLCSAELM